MARVAMVLSWVLVSLLHWPSQGLAQCDGDIDGNGVVGVSDFSLIASCFDDPTADVCDRADLDGDGELSCFDVGAFACQFGGSPDPSCCDEPECFCACNPFQTPDGLFDARQISIVEGCVGAEASGECARADVDCDGSITFCDVDIVTMTVERGEYDMTLCARTTCGACESADECVYRSESVCGATGGAFRPEPCGSTTYRGGGGASCEAAGAHLAPQLGIEAALMLIALLRIRGGRAS